ncbi:FtsQ-type POTRA domain-containing protein [bacterium]|nr:FtsQ-type POTRA domain-containing protein [bacterium]
MISKRKSTGIQQSRTKLSSLGSRKRNQKVTPKLKQGRKSTKSPSDKRRGTKTGSNAWKYLLFVTAVVALLRIVYWGGSEAWQAGEKWLSGTSWAILKRVEVVGLSRLPEHDIIMVAAVKDSSNLMELDLDSISVRVTNLAGVRKARCYRRLPGRLIIDVDERFPVAALGDGDLMLVDEDGAVFPPVYCGEVLDVPVLTGKLKPIVNNKSFVSVHGLLISIRKDYPKIFDHLAEICTENDVLTLRLKSSAAEIITDGFIDKELLDNLEQFLAQKSDELPVNIDYIDMRFPSMVITGSDG